LPSIYGYDVTGLWHNYRTGDNRDIPASRLQQFKGAHVLSDSMDYSVEPLSLPKLAYRHLDGRFHLSKVSDARPERHDELQR